LTGSRRQARWLAKGCDRLFRGANAAVMRAVGSREVMGVRGLAGEEEALFERTSQMFRAAACFGSAWL